MRNVVAALKPTWLDGYKREWVSRDIIAGLTLSAIAIPEVLGYTSISETPLITGLYTIIFPTLIFALLGASRLLVVGADSATAAILAAGLGSAAIAGVTPGSQEWLAYTSFIAILCGAMLVIARVFKLGFLCDFLCATVLVGFLTGIGIQVLSGQIPDMLGIPKGQGSWLEQQWHVITNLLNVQPLTVAFALATLAIVLGFKRWVPKVPGAIVAVVLLIAVSTLIDANAKGVAIVGYVQGGFPPIGLPPGISLGNMGTCLGIAFSCFVLIIAQSAATSRSFAMRHGQKVDINRDIVGLSGANLAAGFTGTFVVNGSPTKTQILDGQRGRTQVANITMVLVALVFALFATPLLTNMPEAVLGAIVFLIGFELIDLAGIRRIWAARRDEAIVATITAAVVCAVGVEQGIILAIVLSLIELIRRQYKPSDFVVVEGEGTSLSYAPAVPGTESAPGLVVFRYDSDLFFANANRFVDEVEHLIDGAPNPVRWLVLDVSAISDVDFSAAVAVRGLLRWLRARDITLGISGVDEALRRSLLVYELDKELPSGYRTFATVSQAIEAFHAEPAASGTPTDPAGDSNPA